VIGYVKLEENQQKNFILSNTLIYHMFMFFIPKTNVKRLDKLKRIFFWQGDQLKRSVIWPGRLHMIGYVKLEEKQQKNHFIQYISISYVHVFYS
jgi:hypothetical protein